MLIHELTPAECYEALARQSHGRLGCSRLDQPYVVPFFFQVDAPAKCLYSFSTPGQKIDWMRENPKVCVEADEVIDQFTWTSVVAFGRYEELGSSRQDEDARRRAHELLQHRSTWWLPALGRLSSGEDHHSSVVYRLVIDRLTGRRAAQTR